MNKELTNKEKVKIAEIVNQLAFARSTTIGYGGEVRNPRLLDLITSKLEKYTKLL